MCNNPLIAYQGPDPDPPDPGDEDWGEATRVWPNPEDDVSWKIPPSIRNDLLEAQRCLNHGTYTASAAMSGRALEGLVRHFTNPGMMLKDGISALRKHDLIDDRLLEWADMLHLERNDSAHASGRVFDKEDATDIFEFAKAIAEYVFDISRRFDQFKARQAQKSQTLTRRLWDEKT
jgi:HEPN domain-containing protein